MTIAIDISSIVYGTGVSIYTQELVKAMSQIDRENQYILFAGSLRQSGKIRQWFAESHLGDNFKLKIFPISPKIQTVLWNDWHLLPLDWLIGRHDIYHSPDWSLAPSRAKTIITVHDLFFLKRPDLQQHPFKTTLERRLYRAKQKNLNVIAVSQATKHDLIELIGYPENLITVVYEAVGSNFNPNLQKQKTSDLLDKYQLTRGYLLMVATHEPRKNLLRTIEAFSKIDQQKAKPIKLVIAGKLGWGDINLRQSDNVKLLGYISNEELPSLYANAQGFLYPSLYEGFGITILEAMACGTPLLTSSLSSMPEVAGEAAIYVDPYDSGSISSGIQKLLNLKSVDRKQMIEKGFKQAKKFSWQTAAAQTLKLYSSL